MKKLLLSLILTVLLLSGSICFSACKKDEYKLSSINNKYTKSIEELDNVKLTKNGLEFIYNEKFSNEINNNAPYTNIKDFYTPMLNYSNAFINEFVVVSLDDEIKTSKKQRKEIDKSLDNYLSSIAQVDKNISSLSELVNIDASSNSTHLKLQDLFLAYENLYQASFDFSNHLQKIYFDYVADYNSNPNLENISQFNIEKNVVLLGAKIANSKVEYSEVFFEKHIRNHNYSTILTQKVDGNFNTVDEEFNIFKSNITSIDKTINSSATIEIIKENESKTKTFHNLSISLYNLEIKMSELNPIFEDAKTDIIYSVEKNNVNISTENAFKLETIDRYSYLSNQYLETLKLVVKLLEN